MINILSVAPQACQQQTKNGAALLRPGRRGERSCLCSGRLHESGISCSWILPDGEVDYSAGSNSQASSGSGLVRLARKDICNGTRLRRGDHVVFFLYASEEHDGVLSAEECCLKSRAVMRMTEAPLWLLEADSDEEEFHVPSSKSADTEESSDDFASGSTACGVSSDEDEEEPVEEEPCEEPCDEEALCEESFLDEREPCEEPCEEPCDDEVSCQVCSDGISDASTALSLLPSRGSSLHAASNGTACRPCTFFRWGGCPKGADCDKCHCEHGRRFGASPADFALAGEDSGSDDDDF
jgi:hypothetical protein